MKDKKVTICIYDEDTGNVLEQVDKGVPDIFNLFDVCDYCEEYGAACETCIVKTLQMNEYILNQKKESK